MYKDTQIMACKWPSVYDKAYRWQIYTSEITQIPVLLTCPWPMSHTQTFLWVIFKMFDSMTSPWANSLLQQLLFSVKFT